MFASEIRKISLKMRKVIVSPVKMLASRGSIISHINGQHLFRSASSYAMAKPFDSIPSPVSAPLIGHGYLMVYKQNRDMINKLYLNLIEELGPLFKLNFFGVRYLVVADPEDAKVLYFNEGEYPKMPSLSDISGFQR